MVPEDLLVWLEACDPATLGEDRPGLLCRRHADAMVVPVGWTLDDHREAVPRLFKVREAPTAPRPSGDHTGRMRRPRLQQASLLDLVAQEMLDDVADPTDAAPRPPLATPTEIAAQAEPAVDGADEPSPAPDAPADAADATPAPPESEPVAEGPTWSPTFDRTDDLGGLLAPRGKLLRRAFGAEPPR
jgi:hypothetical protein